MNKIMRLFIVFIFTLFIVCPAITAEGEREDLFSGQEMNPDNLISMDFQDASLRTILKVFSQQSGLNFVASQNIADQTVTIYFDNVRVEDAITYLMDANNFTYERGEGSNIFMVKQSDKPEIKTITKIYELKYAQLLAPPSEDDEDDDEDDYKTDEEDQKAEFLSVIEGILSEHGKMIADKRSNTLIITDIPSQFGIIEEVLERLDMRTQQVMIEAEIIETSTTTADRLGVNWSGSFGAYTGPVAATIAPLRGRFSKDSSVGEGITTTGSFNMSGVTATLNAVLSDTDTKILARPKILTLNNEKALIELTAETVVAVETVTTSTGETSITSTNPVTESTGITLEVTPQINKDGYITMHIEPTVIVPVLSSFFAEGDDTYVDPQTRKASTTVMVKDGETVIIGGLISKQDTYGFEKIPFLGDIPLLGLAFRYKSKDEVDKELLIFITPHIIKESTYVLEDVTEREQEKPKAVRDKKISSVLDLIGR